MKYLFTTLLLFICSTVSFAQFASSWVQSSGSAQADLVSGCAMDDNGNTYVLGTFTSDYKLAGGTSVDAEGGKDILLRKLDASGKLVWTKKLASSGSDSAASLAVDAMGNVYVAGSFDDKLPVSKDLDLLTKGENDAFCAKFDKDGNLSWAMNVGGSSDDYADKLVVDGNGNVYISGNFTSTNGFAGTIPMISKGGSDAYVLKLNDKGNVMWLQTFGLQDNEYVSDIEIGSSAEIYTNLMIEGELIIGQDTVDAAVSTNVEVVLNAEGTIQDVKDQEDNSNFMLLCSMVDENGAHYYGGSFDGTLSIGNQNFVSAGGQDAIVYKLKSNGELEWAQQLGGSGMDQCKDMTMASDGVLIIAGEFEGTIQSGLNTMESAGESDVFLSEINAEGVIMSSINAGGSGMDHIKSISAQGSSKITATGTFEGTSSFKKDESSNGSDDVYVWQVDRSTTGIARSEQPEFSIYPNPASSWIKISLNENAMQSISIYDLTGRRILHRSGVKNRISVEGLAPGTYFVKSDNGNMSTRKLIIQR